MLTYYCLLLLNFAYNCLLLLTLDWFWLHLLSNFCLLLIIICLYLLSFDYFCLLCLHSTILDYFGLHFTTFACVWFLKIFWNIFPQLSQVDVRLCKHFHRLHHVECRLDRLFLLYDKHMREKNDVPSSSSLGFCIQRRWIFPLSFKGAKPQVSSGLRKSKRDNILFFKSHAYII